MIRFYKSQIRYEVQAGAIWISPSYGEMDLQILADLIVQSRHPFRMQLQLHKQIWGEESGR